MFNVFIKYHSVNKIDDGYIDNGYKEVIETRMVSFEKENDVVEFVDNVFECGRITFIFSEGKAKVIIIPVEKIIEIIVEESLDK